MDRPAEPESRFDAISTEHDLLQVAHQGSVNSAGLARNALALRYRKAIRSYLGRLLHNPADADEVAQEVVVKLLQGGFAGASAARGRFRDYLKTSVRNAALERLRRKRPGSLGELDPGDAERSGGEGGPDDPWLAEWRRTLLDAARQSLRAFQDGRASNVYATVLDLVAEHPEDDSARLAERLAAKTGRPWRADAARQQLSRARRKFAELLAEEAGRTIDDPTPERIREELIELGLWATVKDFLADLGANSGEPRP